MKEKIMRQVNALSYKSWPLEIYKKYSNVIRGNDPLKGITDSYIYPLLKEILISYYTGTFINVLKRTKKQGYQICERCCYLDATAGIGVVPLKIGNNESGIFGSAVIPLISPIIVEQSVRRQPKLFRKIVLVEQDGKRMNILKKVVAEVKEKLKQEFNYLSNELDNEEFINYYYGDFNKSALNILEKYKRNCNQWLIIIDPNGTEISINTIKSILNLREENKIIVDIIFNFMCGSLRRQRNIACKSESHAFDEFFGEKSWRACCDNKEFGECLYQTFEKILTSEGYEVYGTTVWRSNNPWHYHIALIRKQRKKSSKRDWIENYIKLKHYIETIGEEGLKHILTSNDISKYFQQI